MVWGDWAFVVSGVLVSLLLISLVDGLFWRLAFKDLERRIDRIEGRKRD